MIFVIRFITSFCLYTLITQANVWLTPSGNTLLVFGSRFFMVGTPLLLLVFKRSSLSLSLFLAAIGIGLLFFSDPYLRLFAIVLISGGISIAGYLIRFEAAETSSGASYNKIAVNAGSIMSGLWLLMLMNDKSLFINISIVLLGTMALLAARKKRKESLIINSKLTSNPRVILGWIFLSIAIGIKMYSLYSLLPQYLLFHFRALPSWYGFMLTVNGLVIIFLQIPIMKLITKSTKNNSPLKITFIIMCLGMLLLTSLSLPVFTSFTSVLLWVVLLSLVECAVSYLDVEGVKMKSLFIKELFIGVGGGVCVLCSRLFSAHIASLATGCLGILAMIIAILFLFPLLKNSNASNVR
ncbi:MAG: hypothetical protein ORN24_05830 [Burkholderiales bacterium]|nr:hypothetical protein [Burkholderiales bacterium]